MLKKSVFIILLFFVVQIIFSCTEQKICEGAPFIVDATYEDVETIAWDGSNSRRVRSGVAVDKEGLRIWGNLTIYEESVSYHTPFQPFSFNKAMALSCDFEYVFADHAERIEVFSINPETSESICVTDAFGVWNPNGEDLLSISQAVINLRELTPDNFTLRVRQEAILPSLNIFRVEVHLESGRVLTNETVEVTFLQ